MLHQVESKYSIESSYFSLAEGIIDVWSTCLDQDFFANNSYGDSLSEEEKEKAGRFIFEKDRARFVRCRRALRNVLAGYLGLNPRNVEFFCNQYGKPFIDPSVSQIKFNVSHSSDFALIAVTMGREIGVDVEFVNPDFEVMSVAHSVFSDAQVDHLKLLPSVEQSKYFYNGWTRKEAVLKAIGKGFSTPLDQQRVVSELDKDDDVMYKSNVENEISDWSLTSLIVPERYAAALSVAGKMGVVRHRRTSDIRGEFAARFAA